MWHIFLQKKVNLYTVNINIYIYFALNLLLITNIFFFFYIFYIYLFIFIFEIQWKRKEIKNKVWENVRKIFFEHTKHKAFNFTLKMKLSIGQKIFCVKKGKKRKKKQNLYIFIQIYEGKVGKTLIFMLTQCSSVLSTPLFKKTRCVYSSQMSVKWTF